MLPIFLIGYMGSGKTTLGRGVEARAHKTFIDLDEYIEEQTGMTVKEIFAQKGEEGFRLIERDYLRKLALTEDTLIACGGGTPCFFNNIDIMNRRGVTVWLDASVDRLHERLSQARSKRPLIANLDDEQLRAFIIDSLSKRNPYYSRAAHRFDADLLDNEEQLASSVNLFIERFL
ncbi:MAG: shikimate kinase [Barnesiella sp.]|nr:shikimate kinase [Bacteroidales bacterium]MBD5247084.1 shikimate kinase [Barnesiella sp.]MBD5258103.1 shikimate kinase [Barnesiella sp.]